MLFNGFLEEMGGQCIWPVCHHELKNVYVLRILVYIARTAVSYFIYTNSRWCPYPDICTAQDLMLLLSGPLSLHGNLIFFLNTSSLSSEHLVFLFSTAGNDLQGQKTNSVFLSFGSKWLVSYPGVQILNNVRYKSHFFREAILMFNEEGFFWLFRKVNSSQKRKPLLRSKFLGHYSEKSISHQELSPS